MHAQFSCRHQTVRSVSEGVVTVMSNTVGHLKMASCGERKERHAALLLEALCGPSTEKGEYGDFLEVQALGGSHLFPWLPLLLFSPRVQDLLLQQQKHPPVIVLPELPLLSVQAVSQLVQNGKSSLLCSSYVLYTALHITTGTSSN